MNLSGVRVRAAVRKAMKGKNRIAITGGPGAGKTTIVRRLARQGLTGGRSVIHCDDYISHGWAGQVSAAMQAVGSSRRFIVEGVQVARMLKAGLVVDVVIVLSGSHKALTAGQRGMASAVSNGIAQWEKGSGVDVVRLKG